MPARARRHWRRRRQAGADSGSGSGPGLGLGLGSGSLPGLVLFEPGLTGMGYADIPAPLSGSEPPRQRLSVNCRGSWAVGRLKRTVATVRLDSDQNTPPRAL